MKMKISCLLLLLFVFVTSWSQNPTVSGDVMKQNGEALAGATVKVKGTNTATTTNEKGHYTIKVPNLNVTLVFTYVGNATQEVAVNGKTTVTVVMQEESSTLNDVVVVGYATVKRKDLTGSVTSVGAKDVKDIPLNSAAEAIQGRLAGVQVTTTEGRPGAEVMIRVRGGGSLNYDNSPLYIVDGIQVENALSMLSPQEIQSIDVLKDAAATSIYGARAANGVVVITTKGGKEMKTKVSYDAFAGVRKIVNTLDVLNPYEYVKYQYQRYNGSTDDRSAFEKKYGKWEDLDIYKNMPFTNWQDEVFGRDAWNNTHTVGLTGGSKSTSFNFNFSNTDEKGIMLESGFKRTLASFKFDHKATDKLRVGLSTRYSRQRIDGVGTTSTQSQGSNRLRNSVRFKPFIAPGEEDVVDVFDAEYANLTNLTNPVLLTHNELKYDYRNDVNLNGYASLDIIKGLTLKSVLGITNTNSRANTYNGSITSVARSNANMPVVNIATGEALTLTNSNTLAYKTSIKKKHDVDFLIGQEINEQRSKSFNSTVKWLPIDLTPEQAFAGIQKATPPTGQIQDPETTSESLSRLLSFFGRANYSLDGKYLATLTMRYDGTSKLARDTRFGGFPSASFAWRLSKERFFEDLNLEFVNDLKLRFSMGTIGNIRIPNDLFKTMYGTNTSSYAFEEAVTPGMAPPNTMANPNLKWETTISRNLGLDFSLWKGRLSGSIDAYQNNTKDLLLLVRVPSSAGYPDGQIQNIGKTENRGIELQLSGTIINTKNFTWTSNFNIAHNQNKIVSLGTDPMGNAIKSYTVQSGWVNSLNDFLVEVGKPVGQFYGYVTDGYYTVDDFNHTYNASSNTYTYTLKDGIPNSSAAALGNRAPQPGDLKLKKLSDNKDMIIGDADKTVLGNPQPKFTGGFNQQFMYKGFDASIFMNFSYGNKVYNANRMEYTTTYQYKDNNMLAEVANRYQLFDANGVRVTDPVKLSEMNVNSTMWTPSLGNYFLHSYAIEDGSFLRISNLTLGYTLPQGLVNRTKFISKFRVYATVNNLYTFTKYSGYDPEANTRRSNPLTPGVDYAAYPRSRFVLAGVNVTF